ncbi:PspC domain-containing protein [Massilia arenosa]|uniref:PspC domain-containing protein n=1 Tax=Zemynaea arenosa TaxID=2561931 RepID=A0A4Y9S4U7_9BURK|nr:PspC domain-containing protein [Massilia arenosa]TFW16366.1 PspC domain-containing protein [Massilia arenosa]
MSISDEIKRLHELHQAGALTDAEFEAAKARLFASSSSSSSSTGTGSAGPNWTTGTASGPSLNKDIPPGSGDPRADINSLRRSRTDRWLGGVCGGLAKVSGLESWIWRLVFVLSCFLGGVGVLIYLLMWIFVPEEI